MDDAVKVNCYLADMADSAAMNSVYTRYFGEVKPSRTYATHPRILLDKAVLNDVCSCVAVKTLPLGTDIEIECIALVIED